MLLTLYYMYATLIQWWRISSVRSQISKSVNNQSGLILYQKDKQSLEKYEANLKDLLFFTDKKIGCSMIPKKKVFLNAWMPFSPSTLFPSLTNNLKLSSPSFPILIHADINSFCFEGHFDKIQITDLGVPIAWTTEDTFSIILKTDLDNFAKLVSCYLSNSVVINEGMEVLQIETIDLDGEPKIVENQSVFKKVRWPFPVISHKQWNTFVEDLKHICKKTTANISKNGNICILEDANDNKNTIPIIISEVKSSTNLCGPTKKSENHVESSSGEMSSKIELKPEKKSYKRHSDKTNCSVEKPEKTKESKDKDKRSNKEREKLKHSSSQDKIKHKDHRSKEYSEKKEHYTKDEKKDHHSRDFERREHHYSKELEKKEHHHNKETEKKNHPSKETERKDHHSERYKSRESSNHKGKKIVKQHSKENVLDVKSVEDIQVLETSEKAIKQMADKNNVKKLLKKTKSPNVLVYADSLETRENVKSVLNEVLNINRYTIYELTASAAPHFSDNSTLVVVCGSVNPNLTPHLLHYLLNGGNLLCLCSDFLNSVLHTFTTAEVREHELVRFSYGEWKRVRMMHHIFCYQASPAKKHFSQDSDQNSSNHSSSGNSPVAPRTPSTVDLHHNNKKFTVQVRILGQEETWQTPSILLANVKGTGGKAVFSQVHLEVDPTQYQSDENKYIALKESNNARLEILKDILASHLEMDCTVCQKMIDDYKPAYFLGKHESKLKLLSDMSHIVENKLKLSKLTLQFCGKGVEVPQPSSNLLPIFIHSCPENFSTVEYFENLQTNSLGRLVIYADVMTSSMDVLDKHKFEHGLVVLPARQTNGKGRGANAWISPAGCAMFSLQFHISLDSPLGQALPLVQHLVSVAIVSGIRSQSGYEEIDIGLKWPNDIYVDSSIKIGGSILNSSVQSPVAIVNVGSGTNLSNTLPTTCINKLIMYHNEVKGTNLKTLSYEKYLALVFTELERIYDIVQTGNIDYLYELYYKYWLHTGAEITIQTLDGSTRDVYVIGIDQYGFLNVISKEGVTSSVEPDGNTFDMMQGLIAPKIP